MAYSVLTTNVQAAARYLREGRVVAFPTGTAYGLAVDALQGFALQRLRNLKDRPAEKSFTVFVRPELLEKYFTFTADELRLWEAMMGQPLTLLVTPKEAVAHLALEGRVGLRMIDHPLMAALAEAVDGPLTATSANKAGGKPCYSPASIEAVFPGILDEASSGPHGELGPAAGTTYDLSLAAILDGGELPAREPTTIARVEGGKIKIIRQGEVSRESLEQAI